MFLRLSRLALGGCVAVWTVCAAAQTASVGTPVDESYVPDLSQSDVQEIGAGPETASSEALQPLVPTPVQPALQNCQDYAQAVVANGQPRLAYGTACQDADGSWQVASTPTLTSERAYTPRTSGTCREFQQPNVAIDGDHHAYGTACQQPDGTWRFAATMQPSGANTRYCRAYEQDILDGDDTRTAYGTACPEPDGAWRIVTAPAFGNGGRYVDNDARPAMTVYADQAYDAPVREVLTPAPYAYVPPLYSPQSPGPSYSPWGYGRVQGYAQPSMQSFAAPSMSVSRAVERAASVSSRNYRAHSRQSHGWQAERAYRHYRRES